MKKIKETYLLFLIVVGLFSLSIYSTYALFTAEYVVGVVNIDTNSYKINLSNATEYKRINMYSNENRNIILTLLNSTFDNIYYGIYTNNDSDCIKIAYDNSVSSIRGNININMSKTIKININNSCSYNNSFNLYIVTASNSLDKIDSFEDGKKIITDVLNNDIEDTTTNNNIDDNIVTNNDKTLIDYINDLYNNTPYEIANINEDEIYQVSSLGLMKDNFGNLRYYGNNVNNYLKYNNELWQIIGIFEIENDKGNKEKRVKIIRTNSIGKYPFDSKELVSNDFTTSTLIEFLNPGSEITNNYWNTLSEEAKKMVGQVKYYLKDIDGTQEKVSDYYEYNTDNSWLGYVGIMYISDYLYSLDLNSCYIVSNLYTDNNCNSYLTNTIEEEFTMTKVTNTSDNVFTIKNNVIKLDSKVSESKEIRPVVYLNQDIILVSGDGSIDNPYQLK